MKKNIFNLLGGVLLSLPLLFASCGNGDNALEEIINGGGSEGGGSSAINATAITLKQTMEVLAKNGDALTITATATPAEATLTWESSDEAVATVANGVVTPKGAGIATITAKSGDVKATCEVFVGNPVDLGASNYTAENYDILKGDMGTGGSWLKIPAGYKVAFNGLATTGGITCNGDATIILADGSTNTVTAPGSKAGIKIGDGATTTLTINGETAGTGTLTVQGGNGGAGIGTDYVQDNILSGGNIVINGGTITASGGGSAAGIGTGYGFCYSVPTIQTCGDITINGGIVTATGGMCGAGIGTGHADGGFGPASITCGGITINGGIVTATGGIYGAGIGTGLSIVGSASNECGAITIAGVTSVTAKKSSSEPGPNSIGKGDAQNGGTQTCGTITIGGVVKDQGDFTGTTYTYTPSN